MRQEEAIDQIKRQAPFYVARQSFQPGVVLTERKIPHHRGVVAA
jgi:hypothetical protein